jgi:uncharacterized membrane protein
MKETLTKGEQRVWESVLKYFADHNISPTQTEIAINLGYPEKTGRQTIHSFLKGMERKGYIKLIKSRIRNIQIVK